MGYTIVMREYYFSFSDFFFPEHLVRIENSKAEYCLDPVTGRLSVIVPYENPQGNYRFETLVQSSRFHLK